MQKDYGESPVVTDDAEPPSSLAQLTAEIVSAYVSNNEIALSDVATRITAVGIQMAKVGGEVEPSAEKKPEPAVPVRRSIRPDHLVCLTCGKPQKVLKRHLAVQPDACAVSRALRAQARLPDGRAQLRPAAARAGSPDRPWRVEESDAPAKVDCGAEAKKPGSSATSPAGS
jgi:predicted transcriptional regulator